MISSALSKWLPFFHPCADSIQEQHPREHSIQNDVPWGPSHIGFSDYTVHSSIIPTIETWIHGSYCVSPNNAMTHNRRPPVSLSEWMQQVRDDPSIHSDFRNGAEGRLKVSSTAFKSGSQISSTEYLHLNIIWHKYLRIESLGHLMKDDPEISYAGYVSADNMSKADSIFDSNRHLWKPYFDELKQRAAAEKDLAKNLTTQPHERQEMNARHHHLRPSMDPADNFWWPLHCQLLAMTTTDKKPTAAVLERTCAITKPGPTSSVAPAPLSVNQPVSPSPHKLPVRLAQQQEVPRNGGTPLTRSFLPARGGKLNKAAADECYANNALVAFLESITVAAGSEFSSLDWVGGRIGFNLVECTDRTEAIETGDVEEDRTIKELMEARVDGYLCQRSSPFERELNTNALAILEVKPFPLRAALSAIRRQEGAEMACRISEDENSTTGLLQPSFSGNNRRLMINEHRHELYIIVAEYGIGYEKHIRPTVTITKDPTSNPATIAGKSSTDNPTSKPSTLQDSPAVEAPATPKRRNPQLLAGSPSYIERVDKMSIEVSADGGLKSRKKQPTRPPTGVSEWAGEEQMRVPDAAEFLIMHEFGPFLITEDIHMEVFSKRLIAFMLQLSGP